MNESEKDIAKLKAENEALKDRLTKLENQIDPPPRPRSNYAPRDYTAGASMPPQAMRDLINAVPDALMREFRGDARKPNPMAISGGVTKPTATEPPKAIGKKGWIDERPLEVPYIKHVDRLVDAQDAKDKAELAFKLAQVAALGKSEG